MSNSTFDQRYQKVIKQTNTTIINEIVKEPTADELMKQGIRLIKGCDYEKAFNCFKDVIGLDPSANTYYYLALSLINGKKPGLQSLSGVQKIEKYLDIATRLDPECSHAYILWAIVKEDYYVMNGMHCKPPTPGDLLRNIRSSIKPEHRKEMLTHIQSPKNKILESLKQIR